MSPMKLNKERTSLAAVFFIMVVFVLTFFIKAPIAAAQNPIEVRGLFIGVDKSSAADIADFVRNDLKAAKINTLVLSFNYNYQWTSHPELISSNALSRDQLVSIVNACREAGIKFIPAMQFMSHQSCGGTVLKEFLDAYPHLDANPGTPTKLDYCRSWNPLYPETHTIALDLMDELLEVTGADAFHIGMDEAFMLPENDSPYYNGETWAKMFADEVKIYQNHLAASNKTLWLWGDRLLKSSDWNVGTWEADGETGAKAIYPAIDLISPNNIMIADWHYNSAPATAAYFAGKGFDVVSSPWRNSSVALSQLGMMQNANSNIAPHMRGMLATAWTGAKDFIAAYRGQVSSVKAQEVVATFKAMMDQINSTPSAAMPIIQPQSGVFAGSFNVSLSAATPGSEIRYTTNGSEPSINSALYASNFSVSAPIVIKAKTFKSGYAPSLVSVARFTNGQNYPQCSDGVDNDNDGKCDYAGCAETPVDLGCSSASDNDEKDPPPPAILVGHWKFDEDGGQNVLDSSGQGLSGNIFGGVTRISEGKFGRALRFDGSTGYIKIVHPPQNLSKDLTLAFWIKGENIGSSRISLIDKDFGGEFAFVIETDGMLRYYHGLSSKAYFGWDALASGTLSNNNQWHHIAFTRDNTARTIKIYYDGNFKNNTAYSIVPSVKYSKNIIIGDGYMSPLKGSIDDVRIYNKVLNDQEIKQLLTVNPVDSTPPVAPQGLSVQ